MSKRSDMLLNGAGHEPAATRHTGSYPSRMTLREALREAYRLGIRVEFDDHVYRFCWPGMPSVRQRRGRRRRCVASQSLIVLLRRVDSGYGGADWQPLS